MSDVHVVWLDDVERASPDVLGGKLSNLAQMMRGGFAVPPAFGVTTAAFRRFLAASGLEPAAMAALAVNARDLEAVQTASALMSAAILEADLPADVEVAIRGAYAHLESVTGAEGVPVAVRSSGVAEDLAAASFAGQYETFLWIMGADEVLRHVRRCWTGPFSVPGPTYRHEGGPLASLGMAVGVQVMVTARVAGVMFTLDPVNGDRSKVVIEGAWGLGETVVGGEVNPDRYRVDKVTLELLGQDWQARTSNPGSTRRWGRCRHGRRATRAPPDLLPGARPGDRAGAGWPSGSRRHRGEPVDIEWADRRTWPSPCAAGSARNRVEPEDPRAPSPRPGAAASTAFSPRCWRAPGVRRAAAGRQQNEGRLRSATCDPNSVEQALQLLDEHGGGARMLAGGQSLVPMLQMRLMQPSVLIDINRLPELEAIRAEGPVTVVGALTRYASLERSPIVSERLPLLQHVVRFVGDLQVRNRGTIGGSLAQADPTGEVPLACLLLGAKIVAASASGRRQMATEDFLVGSYATALEPEELITEVRFPVAPDRFVFLERGRKHNDFATVSVAAVGRPDGSGHWSDVRIGLGGVHDHAVLLTEAGRRLEGTALEDEVIAEVAQAANDVADPATDVRGTSEYRRHLVGVYVRRALTMLRGDNGGAYA